jgi:hypothetical protein
MTNHWLRDRQRTLFAVLAVIASVLPAAAGGPTTSIQTEYLMTLHAPVDQPQVIGDAGLLVFNVPTGSVEGPRIKGKILAPTGDWGRREPGGVFRLDVRGIIQTDDGEIIFFSYNGVRLCPKETQQRFVQGEIIKADECYFLTAPTFQTKSEKYSWLNSIQAVGKLVAQKRGEGSFITYDIFAAK